MRAAAKRVATRGLLGTENSVQRRGSRLKLILVAL